MIACITGDVHHPLSPTYWDKNEVSFAEEYVEIVDSLGAKATLFITGKCIKKNKKTFKNIIKNYNIELGGHTYYAFKVLPGVSPKYTAIFLKLLSGFATSYGPKYWQKIDILKTINAFKEINLSILSWRTHCYAGNIATYRILNDFGITVVSDKRKLCNFKLKKEVGNLYQLYITMPMDEVITPGDYENNKKWIKNIWNILNCEIRKGANIVFNLHPKRMKMLDDYLTFTRIIRKLKNAGYEFLTVSECFNKFKENW